MSGPRTPKRGGSGGPKPRLAQPLAEGLDDEAALALVDRIINYFRDNGQRGERLGRMIDRVGFDAFKAAVLQ